MNIRKACANDLDSIGKIYDDIHTAEEKGKQTIGWIRGIYPIRATAENALKRNDLFVLEDEGAIQATAIINKTQVNSYSKGHWQHVVNDDQVCVLHTLVVSPNVSKKGYGKRFIQFYEDYAIENGCEELRIDTNARNTLARAMYKKLGYKEVDIIPTDFNGIPGIDLVLLEKYLGK